MKDYNATLTSSHNAEVIFKTITEEMSNWWAPMSGKFVNLGDQASIRFGENSYWSFEASTLNKPSRVVLTCNGAHHICDNLSDKSRAEWLGTKLVFEITEEQENSHINFTHIGLVPELECFDECKAGWDHYFLGSLKDYLEEK